MGQAMRFAIWSGNASGITMPASMARARHVINVRNGWRPALGRLREILDYNSKGSGNQITKLEINCHGFPGRLLLPDMSAKGQVDDSNVLEFAAMLKPHLVKGARIELLACSVAGIEIRTWHNGAKLEPNDPTQPVAHYSKSILEEYWGAYDKAPTVVGKTQGPVEEQTGVHAAETRARIAMAKHYEWDAFGNGLRFCLALAAGTGGIVRASDVLQWETRTNDPAYATDTVGNWEGHVWDFFPDGTVKYLGMNLSRSQGSIAFEPQPDVGRRPMGGIETGSPLRGQRLDRAPLAV